MLGSPISHSRSPALHSAAYRVLGLDWSFEAIEIAEGELGSFFAALDDSWRGFAVTMPLKREVFDYVGVIDDVARVSGAINTVVCGAPNRLGFNTDVYGVRQALAELGVAHVDSAVLLGAGATAASVIVALANAGTERLTLIARSVERAAGSLELAESLGLWVDVIGFDDRIEAAPDVVVSALPPSARFNGAELTQLLPEPVRREVPLLDIAYGVNPSDVCSAWQDAGGRCVSGLAMLLHQAVQQVRIFVAGDPVAPLDREQEVVAAMRAALASH